MKTYRVVWLLELLQSDEKSIERFLANTLIGKHGMIKGLSILHSDSTIDNLIPNSFYKKAVKAWRELNPLFTPGSMQSIRREGVYNNTILVDENGNAFKQPPRIPPYAPEYFSDLPVTNNPREFKGRFRSLIPKMNLSFMKISYSDSGKDEYTIQLEGKRTKLNDLHFTDVYSIFLTQKPCKVCLWVGKWGEDTGITEDSWAEIWKDVTSRMLSYKVQSSLWETLHRNYMCAYFAKLAFNDTGICK